MLFKVMRTTRGKKDAEACKRAGFEAQLDEIVDTLAEDPLKPTQGFERLIGNMKGYYSRQINHHHRCVYSIHRNTMNLRDEHGKLYDGIVYVHRAWGHKYKKPKN